MSVFGVGDKVRVVAVPCKTRPPTPDVIVGQVGEVVERFTERDGWSYRVAVQGGGVWIVYPDELEAVES